MHRKRQRNTFEWKLINAPDWDMDECTDEIDESDGYEFRVDMPPPPPPPTPPPAAPLLRARVTDTVRLWLYCRGELVMWNDDAGGMLNLSPPLPPPPPPLLTARGY